MEAPSLCPSVRSSSLMSLERNKRDASMKVLKLKQQLLNHQFLNQQPQDQQPLKQQPLQLLPSLSLPSPPLPKPLLPKTYHSSLSNRLPQRNLKIKLPQIVRRPRTLQVSAQLHLVSHLLLLIRNQLKQPRMPKQALQKDPRSQLE